MEYTSSMPGFCFLLQKSKVMALLPTEFPVNQISSQQKYLCEEEEACRLD